MKWHRRCPSALQNHKTVPCVENRDSYSNGLYHSVIDIYLNLCKLFFTVKLRTKIKWSIFPLSAWGKVTENWSIKCHCVPSYLQYEKDLKICIYTYLGTRSGKNIGWFAIQEQYVNFKLKFNISNLLVLHHMCIIIQYRPVPYLMAESYLSKRWQ